MCEKMASFNVNDIKGQLEKFLKDEEPLGIIIRGDWGTGKTFFWKEFMKNYSKKENKKMAYVSLFGKESIRYIREDIMTQISVIYKLLGKNSKISKIFSELKGINIGLSTIVSLSSIAAEEEGNDKFKNLIVCFDDFERKSDDVSYKILLGFISYIKETFRCKVVLILNEEEIKKDYNKEIFDEYKEKIIDKEFSYKPTPEENFKLIKEKLSSKEFKEG
ncbi:MAG: P-loop NTPase fold protein, partial [bacterium]